MELRSLIGVSWDELAAAFERAFSDYAVPMRMTAEALERMQTRRGFAPRSSFGAWDGDALVGFVLTCRDGERAYNSGTGVAPSHRRGGLAKQLMARAIEQIHGPYVLEVLADNAKAIALYESLGFQRRRTLQCWGYDGPRAALPTRALPDADGAFEPSWQNTRASIARAIEPFVVVADGDDWAVVFPSNGDLPQFSAANPRLLAGAAHAAGKPLRIINADVGASAFLAAAGCTPTVAQLEMSRG